MGLEKMLQTHGLKAFFELIHFSLNLASDAYAGMILRLPSEDWSTHQLCFITVSIECASLKQPITTTIIVKKCIKGILKFESKNFIWKLCRLFAGHSNLHDPN